MTRPRSGARWLLPGALLGALTLVRPEHLGVSVLLALVVVARYRGLWRLGLTNGAILLLGVGLVIAPWTIRNAVAIDRFVPVSTGGGQVLFAGTYLPSDGDPERVGTEVVARHPRLFAPGAVERLRLEQILARLAAQRHPELPADEALARMGRAQLWDAVSQEPAEYAGFLAAKAWRLWGHGPREVMRKPGWELFHWLLVSLALLGLTLLLGGAAREPGRPLTSERWAAIAIATVLLAITAISLLLVASPRRVLVTVPLLAPLAGVGAAWLRCRIRPPARTGDVDSADSLAGA